MAFSLMATTMDMTGEKVTDFVAIYSYPGLRSQDPRRPDQTLITGLGLDQFGPAHATPIQMPNDAERWYIIYATPNKRIAHINRTPFDPKLPFVHVLINGDPTAFFAVSATGQILPIRVAAISSVNKRYHRTSLDGQPIGFPRI